jgi:hypothetical protein
MRAMMAHVNEAMLRAPIAATIMVLTAEENRVAALTDGAAEALNGTRYDLGAYSDDYWGLSAASSPAPLTSA